MSVSRDPYGPESEGWLETARGYSVGIALVAGVLAAMTVLGLMGIAGIPVGMGSGRGIVALSSLLAWGVAACAGVWWALNTATNAPLAEQKLEVVSVGALLAMACGSTWFASVEW